jgi:Tfp pilus assembly protein PilW
MRKKGFTIVELLIYMGLMSGFLVIMGNVFFSVLDLQLESKASSDVQQDGQFILSRLGYDLRRATAVSVPATAGETGNSLIMTIGGSNFAYSVNGGDLQLTAGGGSQNLTSFGSSIQDFSVTRLQNPGGLPSLKISFTLVSRDTNLQQRSEVKSYEETLTLR